MGKDILLGLDDDNSQFNKDIVQLNSQTAAEVTRAEGLQITLGVIKVD